jgi:sialate O-acetylesterase
MLLIPISLRCIALSCLAFTCLVHLARAKVIPAPLFTDNAVLQRDKPVPVWGKADAGENVVVTFGNQTTGTIADTRGNWMVTLAPMPANGIGAKLVIKGTNTIALDNIVVGEVWLASGQSNMEWVVRYTHDAAIDVPASANFPLIRHIRINRTVAESPADNVDIDRDVWEVAGPATTLNFSAVAYYFAKDVNELAVVPVGIIGSYWGGTNIEAWMSPESLASDPAFASVAERWQKTVAEYPEKLTAHHAAVAAWEQERDAARSAGTSFTKHRPYAPAGPGGAGTPSGLYNGMINPLVPYALRGAIWYQGEANAGRANQYHSLFASLITDWRARFKQGDFPFYWVQLANYSSLTGTDWAFLREAQTQTLSLPNTGQAVIIDIGNRSDIHPRNKKDVGRRLARLALARDYGFDIETGGPVMKTVQREGSGYRVGFSHVAGGLMAPLNELGGFELAGADKVFKPAAARIEGDDVIVTNVGIPDPVAVRYAWRDAPEAGLFGKDSGLPAAPFRSDRW